MAEERCGWAKSELEIAYHDNEWCHEEHDDRKLFEMLILEGMQAGLSWSLILARRENMRKAFDGFDPEIIAGYTDEKRAELLQNPSIIRNRLKINALIENARAYLRVQQEFGSFSAYLWGFVQNKQIQNHWTAPGQMPASTEISEALSKDMKKRGFRFVGGTILYSFMQAAGMVNDHLVSCPWHAKCGGKKHKGCRAEQNRGK